MKFDKIRLKGGFRMLRVGFGQNVDKWFVRFDLWWVGIRLSWKRTVKVNDYE